MHEKRYNIFNLIHKGLRGMLYNTAIKIQQTDFAEESASAAIIHVEEVLYFFDEHAAHEDQFILPHIQQHNQELYEQLEKDHEVDHQLTIELYGHVADWKSATDKERRRVLGEKILYAFNEFIAFNLYHMNKEENLLIFTLWKHYTDKQIMDMEHEILQSIKPDTLFAESRWMMRSISNSEIIGWLSGMKQAAPEEVFNAYVAMAEEELSSERMTHLRKSFAEAVVE